MTTAVVRKFLSEIQLEAFLRYLPTQRRGQAFTNVLPLYQRHQVVELTNPSVWQSNSWEVIDHCIDYLEKFPIKPSLADVKSDFEYLRDHARPEFKQLALENLGRTIQAA